jgi:hypothetical protein
MIEEDFYAEAARLLQTTNNYHQPREYMRRWGPRTPGNGRFPNHGIIRAWAADKIHIALHTPTLNGSYTSYEAALQAIKESLTPPPNPVP